MKNTLLFLILLLSVSCAALPFAVHAADRVVVPSEPNGGRSPAYSPDGTKIAFLSSTLHTPADLWVMNADGTGKRRLTVRGARHFRWSRDGKSIEFVTRRKGFEEVMRIALEGAGGEERVPGLPPNSGIPVHSPDGMLFAFTAPAEQPNVRDLWIGTADGGRIEAVTEKISVRTVFWSPDSRKIYYEAGKSYGVAIWEFDLSAMESRPLLSKYVGTPVYSMKAGRIAYPYPTNPGEYEVHTMRPDGSDIKTHKAPRLAARWLSWDAEGTGVYYLGQDIEKVPSDNAAKAPGNGGKRAAPHETVHSETRPVGVTAVWHLDFATGREKRISPASLHSADFSLSPDGKEMVLAGVLENSRTSEVFRLRPETGEWRRLTESRVSAWMPVPSPDATRIAYFTNEGALDSLKVACYTGEAAAAYTGFVQEGDTRLFWLPGIEGLMVFSGRGLHAFSDNGAVAFPNKDDHRSYLYADVSLQEDKVLISTIPRYGETPGLYRLDLADNTFKQTDLRYPPAPETAAELYLHPKWSNDGGKIAFTDSVDVWTMRGDGTGRIRLTRHAEGNKEGKENPARASYPFWSVDGKRLGYTLTVYEGKKVRRELWVRSADGTDPKKLFAEELDSEFQVFQPEYTHQPFFDATDEHVIFTALRDGIPNVFSVGVADGKARALTATGAIFPALLPEEGTIVYVSLEGNDERLRVMNTDGSEQRPFGAGTAETGAPARAAGPAPR
jgi:Tol biopolymer transport system component